MGCTTDSRLKASEACSRSTHPGCCLLPPMTVVQSEVQGKGCEKDSVHSMLCGHSCLTMTTDGSDSACVPKLEIRELYKFKVWLLNFVFDAVHITEFSDSTGPRCQMLPFNLSVRRSVGLLKTHHVSAISASVRHKHLLIGSTGRSLHRNRLHRFKHTQGDITWQR
jgi:hypothetical protein